MFMLCNIDYPMYIVGITGNVGTGKSLIGRLLREKNFHVIDVDLVAKDVIENNKETLCKQFPELLVNGKFSKSKLKEIIFMNRSSKKRIERILHLKIFVVVMLKILVEAIKLRDIVFLEIPLFFEYNLDRFFDSIVVFCDKSIQAERIRKRDGCYLLYEKLNAQQDMEEKKRKGTFLINNNQSIAYTKKQLDNLQFNGHTIYFYVLLVMSMIFVIKIVTS